MAGETLEVDYSSADAKIIEGSTLVVWVTYTGSADNPVTEKTQIKMVSNGINTSKVITPHPGEVNSRSVRDISGKTLISPFYLRLDSLGALDTTINQTFKATDDGGGEIIKTEVSYAAIRKNKLSTTAFVPAVIGPAFINDTDPSTDSVPPANKPSVSFGLSARDNAEKAIPYAQVYLDVQGLGSRIRMFDSNKTELKANPYDPTKYAITTDGNGGANLKIYPLNIQDGFSVISQMSTQYAGFEHLSTEEVLIITKDIDESDNFGPPDILEAPGGTLVQPTVNGDFFHVAIPDYTGSQIGDTIVVMNHDNTNREDYFCAAQTVADTHDLNGKTPFVSVPYTALQNEGPNVLYYFPTDSSGNITGSSVSLPYTYKGKRPNKPDQTNPVYIVPDLFNHQGLIVANNTGKINEDCTVGNMTARIYVDADGTDPSMAKSGDLITLTLYLNGWVSGKYTSQTIPVSADAPVSDDDAQNGYIDVTFPGALLSGYDSNNGQPGEFYMTYMIVDQVSFQFFATMDTVPPGH